MDEICPASGMNPEATAMDRGPVRAPPQFPDEVLDQTIALLQPRAGRPLSREDAREALYNVTGAFELLLQWKKAKLARLAGGG